MQHKSRKSLSTKFGDLLISEKRATLPEEAVRFLSYNQIVFNKYAPETQISRKNVDKNLYSFESLDTTNNTLL